MSKECSNNILMIIIIVSGIISFITIFTVSYGYDEEDAYCDAIKAANYYRPIIDISLTKKNEKYEEITLLTYEDIPTFCDCTYNTSEGHAHERVCYEEELQFTRCNEYNKNAKARKFYNTTLYVLYYHLDYFGLFERVEVDEKEQDQKLHLCKKKDDGSSEYIICGKLDSFNNPFCIEQIETCPINDIKFIYNGSKIEKIELKRKDRESPVIKRLIISEKPDASIYDINKIITYKNRNIETQQKIKYEEYYKLEHLKDEQYQNYKYSKSTFFKENNLIKGYIPDWFEDETIYLYKLDYFGNNFNYPLHKYHINMYQRPVRISTRVCIFIFKIYFLVSLCIDEIKCIKKKINIFLIINISFDAIYLAFVIMNIILAEAKYYFSMNVKNYYLNLKYNEDFGSGAFTFFVDICQIIFELLIFLIYPYIFWTIYKENKDTLKLNDENKNDLIINNIN